MKVKTEQSSTTCGGCKQWSLGGPEHSDPRFAQAKSKERNGTVTVNETPHQVHAEVCKYRAQGRDLRS